MATSESISFADEKDESIVFILAVEITSVWLEEDEFEIGNWDTSTKTIKLKKNEITYTLLHGKIQQTYPFILELSDEETQQYYEVNIYDTDSQQQIINDHTLNEVMTTTTHKNKEINLTLEIADRISPIVCDNGSHFIKAGFGGDDAPRAVFPNIIGIPKHNYMNRYSMMKNHYIGDAAQSKIGILSLKCPMDEKRQINSFDDMEKVWHHSFYNECRIDPEENSILLTDSVLNPKSNREKMVQIMFEYFNTPACYIEYQPILALIASDRKTGIVLDSGWNTTECTPIYNGKIIKEAVNVSYFGGRDITNYLAKILNGNFVSSNEMHTGIVRDIKEKACYAKNKLDINMSNNVYNCSKEYDLGRYVIHLSDEQRYMPVECLFNPKLMNKPYNCDGFHELIYKSIMKCHVNIRSELFNNIVLCGGNTMFPLLKERLTYELEQIKHNNEMIVNGYVRKYNNKQLLYDDIMHLLYKYSVTNLKVIDPPDRKYSVWIGGSILANRSMFEEKWITKAEYDEFGSEIVHKKCT
eukprot:467366_1